MSKEYVLNKLKELEEVIDLISDEDLKTLVSRSKYVNTYEDTYYENTSLHVHSPEFLRET